MRGKKGSVGNGADASHLPQGGKHANSEQVLMPLIKASTPGSSVKLPAPF